MNYTRIALIGVSILLIALTAFPAKTVRAAEPNETSVVISGKVLDDNNRPVNNAIVIICDQNSGVPLYKQTMQPVTTQWLGGNQTTDIAYYETDSNGGFTFENLQPGRYRLIAQSWLTGKEIKGLLEINGLLIKLYGTAENIEVSPSMSVYVEIKPVGNGTLLIDEKMPNDETFLVISTAPTSADPILGFASWSGDFIKNMIGFNRMPEGKTSVYGLPEGTIYVSMFAADSVPGFAEGKVQIEADSTVMLPYTQFVNSWSDSRHTAPEELKGLVEELKSANIDPNSPIIELYRRIQTQGLKNQYQYTSALIEHLNDEFELPSGRVETFGRIAAGLAYISLENVVTYIQEKRSERDKLTEQLKSKYEEKIKKGILPKPIDYTSADTFFPDDPEAGKKLDILLANKDSIFHSPPYGDWLDIVRRGFRTASIDTQRNLMSTISYKYITQAKEPNELALDIVYYASFDPNLTDDALYNGLARMKNKPQKVLERLVETALEYRQLSTIKTFLYDQKDDFLQLLEPYSQSSDPNIAQRAQTVKQVLDGTVNGYKLTQQWDQIRARQRTEKDKEKYLKEVDKLKEQLGAKLPELKKNLIEGSSQARLEALKRIEEERLYMIIDEDFFDAFEKCAEDANSLVRRSTITAVGRHWIWSVRFKQQSQRAIQLAMKLSEDPDPEVQKRAVRYGLSVIKNKSDEIIKQLINIAMTTADYDVIHRIAWGLQSDKESAEPIILNYLETGLYSRDKLTDLYIQIFEKDPPALPENQ